MPNYRFDNHLKHQRKWQPYSKQRKHLERSRLRRKRESTERDKVIALIRKYENN